jgi:nucleoside-diphosphate-sugar epimerase
MPEFHLIVGAGPAGRHVADYLAQAGHRVVVATRSGIPHRPIVAPGAPTAPNIASIALDASDTEALTRAATGAAVIYNCANPGNYTLWERDWPPLAHALLIAAQRTGAGYAIAANLYPYGPVDGPMTEGMGDNATDHKGRLMARMWADARAAHDAGRVRAVQVRSSDFVGAGVRAGAVLTRVLPGALRGRAALLIGRPSLPHTFTDVADTARTLIAAAADPTAYGRIWHTPSHPALPAAQVLTDILAAAKHPPVRIVGMRGAALTVAGALSPFLREVRDLRYQWERPYIMSSQVTSEHFALEPSPWEETCRRSLQVTG